MKTKNCLRSLDVLDNWQRTTRGRQLIGTKSVLPEQYIADPKCQEQLLQRRHEEPTSSEPPPKLQQRPQVHAAICSEKS